MKDSAFFLLIYFKLLQTLIRLFRCRCMFLNFSFRSKENIMRLSLSLRMSDHVIYGMPDSNLMLFHFWVYGRPSVVLILVPWTLSLTLLRSSVSWETETGSEKMAPCADRSCHSRCSTWWQRWAMTDWWQRLSGGGEVKSHF